MKGLSLNKNKHRDKKEFPLQVFAAAFVISLLATIFSGWQSWRMHYLFEEMSARHITLTKRVGHIMLLDEVLTMSARMAAATGDINYEKRYNQFDPELTKEIKEVRRVLPQLEIKQFVDETDEGSASIAGVLVLLATWLLAIRSTRSWLAERKESEKALRELQEELVCKEKLAVLGQVAGSVGHELRNPLGVMSNAVFFLQSMLSDADETTREYLEIIKSEITASEHIVSDLLDSVRTKPPHSETVNVAQLIEQSLDKCTIPPSVEVKLNIPESLPPLRVDAIQIRQVFRNLISNGVEAMSKGGTVEVVSESGKGATISVILPAQLRN